MSFPAAEGQSTERSEAPASGALIWERDGATWPLREASRFVDTGGLRWHVQIVGQGPILLLLHGTGASTHSWRDLIPRLAHRFTVVAPDLPGHAFTKGAAARHMSLPGMAAAVRALLGALELSPRIAAGHSAGAAVLVQMCLDGMLAPAGVISFNGAMLPIGGVAGQIFSPLAKFLASGSVLPRLFARWAGDEDVIRRLIRQTGSILDETGFGYYARLARDPRHTAGALAMMANWDLQRLERALPSLDVPLVLVVGSRDGSIPPSDAHRIRGRVRNARVETLRGLGHLAHEERPVDVARIIERYAAEWAVVEPVTAAWPEH